MTFNDMRQESASQSWKYSILHKKNMNCLDFSLCINIDLIIKWYAVFLWNAIWWVSYELCAEMAMDICEEQIYQIYQIQRHNSHDECCCFCRVFGTSPKQESGVKHCHAQCWYFMWQIVLRKLYDIFVFSFVSGHGDKPRSWNISLPKNRMCLSYSVNAMAADVLVIQGARMSAAITLTCFMQNILAAAS